jgi:hypothetical protein
VPVSLNNYKRDKQYRLQHTIKALHAGQRHVILARTTGKGTSGQEAPHIALAAHDALTFRSTQYHLHCLSFLGLCVAPSVRLFWLWSSGLCLHRNPQYQAKNNNGLRRCAFRVAWLA